MNTDLVARQKNFIEMETRSCSMESALITPEYVYRMWGGKVELSEIEEAMKTLQYFSTTYFEAYSINVIGKGTWQIK